jgi:hypothetical protein
MSTTELLQQALDALNDITYNDDNGKCNACGHDYGGHVYGAHYPGCKVDAACDAIRAHLAAQPAPAAVPVAWMLDTTDGKLFRATDSKHNDDWLPLYTAPPAPVPVPLTDEQIDALYINGTKHWIGKRQIARAIERAHGIGIAASPEVPK